MFNPFFPLTQELLSAFVETGHRYFVRQTLERAKLIIDENVKGYYIITHYTDKAQAEQHLSTLNADPHRFLYEWDNKEQRERLIKAAGNPEGYKVFSSVFQANWKNLITPRIKEKIRKYLQQSLNWMPRRNDVVNPELFVQWGELYVTIHWGNRVAKVKFDEIEKLK